MADDDQMRRVQASGFLVFRSQPRQAFLLMRHADRFDLPKGHVDPGESALEAAFRELAEETGIRRDDLRVDDSFRFVVQYPVNHRRYGKALKTLTVFLGTLQRDVEVRPTEHDSFEWINWQPPHRIQHETIDPLLEAVARHRGQS